MADFTDVATIFDPPPFESGTAANDQLVQNANSAELVLASDTVPAGDGVGEQLPQDGSSAFRPTNVSPFESSTAANDQRVQTSSNATPAFSAAAGPPPVISAFTPGASQISRAQSIAVSVTDAANLDDVTITAAYPGIGTEVVYASGAFTTAYTAMSGVVLTGLTSRAFTIIRTNGWRGAFTLRVVGINLEGTAAEDSAAYTLTAGLGDAPSISNYVPAPNTPISRTQAIQFDVLDTGVSFALVTIAAYFATTGVDETVIRNGIFRPYYSSSTRTAIANGYRYVVRRTGGWPVAPEFFIDAVDTDGNVSS